jgi:putative colanic acid biosynthesis UDP-glucose lipid carrier transferase
LSQVHNSLAKVETNLRRGASAMDISDCSGEYRRPRRPRRTVDFLSWENDLLFGADVVAGCSAGYLTYLCYRVSVLAVPDPSYYDAAVWREVALGSVIAALVLREPEPARGGPVRPAPPLWSAIAQRGAATLAILLTVGLATRALDDMARLWLLGWSVVFAAWVLASRWALLAHTNRMSLRGDLREAVAVLGRADIAAYVASQLSGAADVVAVLGGTDNFDPDIPCSALSGVQDLVNSGCIDTVVLALPPGRAAEAIPLLQQLKAVPVQVTICTGPSIDGPAPMAFRMLGGMPLAVVADRPLNRWDLLLKALLDRLGAVVLLTLTAPLMLAAALAIIAETPGPVIYRQARRGWGGQNFVIYKLRTMRHQGQAQPFRQTERGDPRCTRVGAVLRTASIDELPQLWNVLRGDMSLVGPRPHFDRMPDIYEAGVEIVAEYAQRQRVKPGMTGWAQIHGARGAVSTTEQMRRRVEYDLYYIDHWSVWLDLYIIACTPLCLLRAENAF